MQSLAYIPASNGIANASLMTVQTVRAANAPTITVNTVAGASAKFYGSMGTPHTFTDPQTGETITIISESTAVDFAGSVSGSTINIDAIAPGYTDTGSKVGDIIVIRPITEWANNIFNTLSQSLNDNGSLKAAAITYNPNVSDYIQTGGIWSTVSGLNVAMTALTAWQGGYQGSVAAVVTRAFTASKDTYVDVLRTLSGYTNTFTLVYTEVANGATTGFALAANSIRLAKVVTNATVVVSITQGGLDSLANNIRPSGAVGANVTADLLKMPSAANKGASLGIIYLRNVAFPYTGILSLTRIGNVVFATGAGNTSPATNTGTAGEVIPYGYRPAVATRINGVGWTGASTTLQSLHIAGSTSGTADVNYAFFFSNTGNQENHIAGSWVTADPVTPIIGDGTIIPL